MGDQAEEWIFGMARVVQDQGPLAEIVEKKGRERYKVQERRMAFVPKCPILRRGLYTPVTHERPQPQQ